MNITSEMDFTTCYPGVLWPIGPLGLRSAGLARIEPGWRHATGLVDDRLNFYWAVAGEIAFRADAVEYVLRGGEIIYFPPGYMMTYSERESRGRFCWMTLCGSAAVAVMESGGFRAGHPLPVRECPVARFEHLLTLLRTPSPNHCREAELAAYAIIIEALRQHAELGRNRSELAARIKHLIDQDFSHPELNVDRLAEQLHCHRSGISRHFTQAYGLSPSAYLNEKRLGHARQLLWQPELSIAAVAERSGFTDPAYFSRLFHRVTGTAPRQFRQRLSRGDFYLD